MLDKIIEIIMTILPFLGNRKKRKGITLVMPSVVQKRPWANVPS